MTSFCSPAMLAPVLCLSLGTVVPAAPQGGFVECTRVIHTLRGEAAGDQFGWVSAPVPDVDGDGVAELLIGAPFHDSGGTSAGRVYLFSGRSGVERFHADGSAAQQRLGFAVRDAGDLDGDSICDVVVGGRGTANVAGIARVHSGATGFLLRSIQLGAAGDYFGYSVTGIGDVDLDGTIDLAVGAPLDDSAGTDAGRVVVVSGADGTTVVRSLPGEAAGDNFGTALGSLGDVTGDGRPELAVGAGNAGAFQRGKAYVYDLANDVQLYDLEPDPSGAEFGQFFVAEAGNLDGDPFPDLYVGDFADGGGGKAYLFAGPTGAPLFTLAGGSGDGFGIGRPLGDVDGDGRDDLVLGAFTASDGAVAAGRAGIYSGADGALLREVTSTTAGEEFGFDAHGLGDVDGDGVPEMVVTAAHAASLRGRVYVIADRPVASFGIGLPGSGGIAPRLDFPACPRLGSGITFATTEVLGGANGVLVIGTRRIDRPIRGGILYPDLDLCRVHHTAGGTPGLPGAGTATLAFTLPVDPALVGRSFYGQAIYHDPGAPAGFSFTPAQRLTLY